jgi:SPOR domain
MADRYQDRPFPADDDGRSDASGKGETDPLAELARLIGQTDPFGTIRRANLPVQPRAMEQDRHDPYQPPPETDDGPAPGPPSWMQRAVRPEAPPPPPPQQDYPSAVHPLHRYASAHAAPEADYDQAPALADADHERDLSRYDDALYGEIDSGAADPQHDPAYADDAYAYQEGYGDGTEEEGPKRRGGMIIVGAVLALAVFGVGGAFAYRSYMGSARSGEPPIIRADAGPTKIIPAPADANAKLPDRLSSGDGTEKIVPREEAPVDVNARSGPRVVFPPLNQNGTPPSTASVAPGAPLPANSGNGTLPNNEPRKIRTFSVRGDQADTAATPAAATPPAAAKPSATGRAAAVAPRTPPQAANASAANGNAPLSLSPQAAQQATEPPTRVATTTPAQTAPSGGGGGAGYLVQVSSQRNEADAQASYRALQGKFPAVLGSRAPMIKRADLGDKGVYYRAMVGPFGSPDEASQFCGSLKSAGGQCVVQRN